jgi:hypothetical protein
MGMIWNSADTLKFLDKVNKEFEQKYTDWVARRELFNPNNTGTTNKLLEIKKVHGPHVGITPLDKKWMKWLDSLGSVTDPSSAHMKLRTAIYNGLDDQKYLSIFFQLMPLPNKSDVVIEEYANEDEAIMGVLIKTPTYDQMKQLVRKTARNRRNARAAAKKKL